MTKHFECMREWDDCVKSSRCISSARINRFTSNWSQNDTVYSAHAAESQIYILVYDDRHYFLTSHDTSIRHAVCFGGS